MINLFMDHTDTDTGVIESRAGSQASHLEGNGLCLTCCDRLSPRDVTAGGNTGIKRESILSPQCCSVNGHHSSVWKPLPCHFLLLVHDRRPTRSPNQALMRAARPTAQRSCMAEGLFEVVFW
ncbi:hypothetical protein F7725_014534 [Dissostichus mawsoni]|uniref:Uncharacterized protein n=1 Tax=Dissostichus mawsoni TaxID=36200 RepID=A0A7J5YWP5_DISMA|nr:hypothetical protein F7725_014534 [Dissostichus mawsoni]